VQGRLGQRLAFLDQQAMGVLDRHRGIVDEDADRERQSAERHGVQGFAQEMQHDQRGKNRERDRDHDHERRAPRPRNSRIISCRQRGRDRALAQHAGNRILHEHGLIEQFIDLHARRRRRARGLQRLVHGIDDGQGRGVAVLDDAEQHRTAAVLPHHVLLHQPAVMDLADILDEDGGAVHDLDRNIVEIVDRGRRRIGADDILRPAEFRGARRQGQVLRVDRVDHIERGQPLGEQLVGIDIDHDLAVFAARRRRQRDAGYRRELLADAIDAVIIELLFAQRIRAQADLQHRHARCVELHHQRRLDSRRHQGADGVGGPRRSGRWRGRD